MPKKKANETQEAQSERFREAVRAAIDAGELNPIEADERFERALANSALSHLKDDEKH
jgi:hypothetical protein